MRQYNKFLNSLVKNEASLKLNSWTFWERAVKANTAQLQRGGEYCCFETEVVTDSDLKTTALFYYSLEGIKVGEESCLATGDKNPGGSLCSHLSSERKGGGRVIFSSKFWEEQALMA